MLHIYKITSNSIVDFAAEELKKYLRMMMPESGDVKISYDPTAKCGFRLGLMQDFSLDIIGRMLYNIPMKKYIIILILIVLIFAGFFACPFYNFAGVPCPACGITRACKLFLTGRIKDAFIMHPLFWMHAIFIFNPFIIIFKRSDFNDNY